MKKRLSVFVLIFCLMLPQFSSCGKKSDVTKTLFIYMCGSDLESKNALGGKTIDEILSVPSDPGTKIVIETGGAKKWNSHDIDPKKTQRYEVKDGQLTLIESLEMQNMGDSKTLTDFVSWGKKNYPSSQSMLIFWDHGGGSAEGVCSDENYNYDNLTFAELEKGLSDAKLSEKFNIIGFDACFMASLESAKAIKDYARYMVASEELEPAGGWDYVAFLNAFFEKNDPVETGKVICDSYLEKCKKKGREHFCTLSIADLSHYDEMFQSFQQIVEYLQKAMENKENLSSVNAAVDECEQFGINNILEGGANMIDFLDFSINTSMLTGIDSSKINSAISSYILYSVSGEKRHVGGLSFYYPVFYKNGEIRDYIKLGVSKEYNDYLRTYYLNVPPVTIEFLDKGHVNENGAFEITLSKESKKYLKEIYYFIYSTKENGVMEPVYAGLDVRKNWNDMKFSVDFKGTRLALEDHGIFALQISDSAEISSFITPVEVGGESSFLRFLQLKDSAASNKGDYFVEGIWKGYDENNLPVNDVKPLSPGDRIVVTDINTAFNIDHLDAFREEIVIGNEGPVISRIPLDKKNYRMYCAAIDIFGKWVVSDMAEIELTKTYEELLSPLPENEQAGKITKIEPMPAH